MTNCWHNFSSLFDISRAWWVAAHVWLCGKDEDFSRCRALTRFPVCFILSYFPPGIRERVKRKRQREKWIIDKSQFDTFDDVKVDYKTKRKVNAMREKYGEKNWNKNENLAYVEKNVAARHIRCPDLCFTMAKCDIFFQWTWNNKRRAEEGGTWGEIQFLHHKSYSNIVLLVRTMSSLAYRQQTMLENSSVRMINIFPVSITIHYSFTFTNVNSHPSLLLLTYSRRRWSCCWCDGWDSHQFNILRHNTLARAMAEWEIRSLWGKSS